MCVTVGETTLNFMTIANTIRGWFTPEEVQPTTRQMVQWLRANVSEIAEKFSNAELELALDDKGYAKNDPTPSGDPYSNPAWVHAHQEALGLVKTRTNAKGELISEAFTQADIELALDDRGWLVGGKRQMGELDPLSRMVQVNRSRYYWLRDPLVKQAVRLWTDYALGADALSYTCDDAKVQKELDKFMKDRRNHRYCTREGQRRLSQRLLVDGELFFGVFGDGTIKTFDCLQITDIITDKDDEDVVLAYKRVMVGRNAAGGQTTRTLYYRPWDLADDKAKLDVTQVANDGYNLVPIDPQGGKAIAYEEDVVMYHLAFDAIERRGNGLITCCSDWAREHRRFMIARVAITQALAKFAFTTTVKGGQTMVNSIRAKLESTFAQSGLSGGTQHQPVAAPGANFLSNEGIELKAMPRVTGGAEAATDADGLKLMVSAGTGIMLHYFGDPGNANLATATAMELPMLKQFASYQLFWKDAWRDLFAMVLEEGPDDEPAEILITLPDIIEDDLQPLGMFLTQLTTVFPEAKVPQLLKQCLDSANVPDIDEVMKAIEANKEALDAQAKLDAQTQQNNQLQLVNAKQGNNAQDPAQGGTINPDTPGAANESANAKLLAFLKDWKESLVKDACLEAVELKKVS